MRTELDDYPTLRIRLGQIRATLDELSRYLSATIQRTPVSYRGNHALTAIQIDLRELDLRIATAMIKCPADEQEARDQ